MHPGWAAQSGIRAALLARNGFQRHRAPCLRARTACFHGFAHTTDGKYDLLVGDFGTRWLTETLSAFKLYIHAGR